MTSREVVRSRANPAFKRLLERRRRARGEGLLLLEGPKLLREALDAGLDVVEAACSERAAGAAETAALLLELQRQGARVRTFADELLDSLSEVETSQGVLALAQPPAFDADAVFAGTPLVLACCAIQNPGNVGALLRTAEAAGASGALLSEGCADAYSWKALRGSMGSAFRLPHLRGLPLGELPALLRGRGVRAIAADAKTGRRYDEIDWRVPAALLVGAEGAGLPDGLLRAADERVAIPLRPPVESLNVGVAAGVLLFAAALQRSRDGA